MSQTITIEGLSDDWLPVAYGPRTITTLPGDLKVSKDRTTSSLIVSRPLQTGDTIELISRVYSTPVSAAQDYSSYDPQLIDSMLELPSNFSARATSLAAKITVGSGNDVVKKANLLVAFFHSNFTYSIGPRSSGANALDTFLFEDRIGYCEQFASAFAALARSVGIPARVAIGFAGVVVTGQAVF